MSHTIASCVIAVEELRTCVVVKPWHCVSKALPVATYMADGNGLAIHGAMQAGCLAIAWAKPFPWKVIIAQPQCYYIVGVWYVHYPISLT